jgi:hypothetical protein
MVGHKWVKAFGTVVEVRGHAGPLPPPGSDPVLSVQAVRDYVVDIRDPKGGTLRTTVSHESRLVHPIGATLPVDVNFKSGEASIDQRAMADWSRQRLIDMNSAAGGTGGSWTSRSAAAGTGLGAGGVHIINAGGQVIQASQAQAGEIHQLAQALQSGDPAAVQAAKDRLLQLKDQLRQGLGAPGGAGVAAGGAGGVAGGVAGGTVEQRLAVLQDLVTKGVLTEAEYQAQRQRIIEQI